MTKAQREVLKAYINSLIDARTFPNMCIEAALILKDRYEKAERAFDEAFEVESS